MRKVIGIRYLKIPQGLCFRTLLRDVVFVIVLIEAGFGTVMPFTSLPIGWKGGLEVAELSFGQLGEGTGKVVGGKDGAVVFVDALHEVDAVAHLGGENDADGFALAGEGLGFGHAVQHLLHVVAVGDDDDGPHEGLELGLEVAEVHDLLRSAVDLLVVVVDGGDEVVDVFGAGKHDGFPNLAFLQLAVAVEGVDKVVVVGHLFAQCGADADAKALAQRTAGHADAGEAVLGGGVALEARAELAEGFQLVDREKSAAGHGAVDDGRDVALRHEEHVLAVAVHGEAGGVLVKDVELHGSHPVGCAQRATGVAGFGGGGHSEYIATHLRGDGFKFFGGFHY